MNDEQRQDNNNVAATEQPTPMVQVQPVAPLAQPLTDKRSYLTMMLLAVFAMPTGLARVYRGEDNAKVRFWVFVASCVLFIIPLINLLSVLAIFVLSIWGLVDLFILKDIKTDASGQDLLVTPTDRKWGNGFFIFALVALSLSLISFIITVTLGVAFLKNVPGDNATNIFGPDTQEYRLPSQGPR